MNGKVVEEVSFWDGPWKILRRYLGLSQYLKDGVIRLRRRFEEVVRSTPCYWLIDRGQVLAPHEPRVRGWSHSLVPFPYTMTSDRMDRILDYAFMDDEALYVVDTADLDRAAFGFTTGDLMRVPLDRIKVQYKMDIEEAERHDYDLDSWRFALSEPIELKYRNGDFYIEDGHHRFVVAQRLGERDILAVMELDDNPIIAIRALAEAHWEPRPGSGSHRRGPPLRLLYKK
jgi:hypothetical protein